MKRSCTLAAVSLFFPTAANAQQTVQSLSSSLITFLNTTIVPFLFTIALVIFIYSMVRYFIIDINDYDGRENARNYAIYSIIAFVLMVSVWGIVNLLVAGIGLGREEPVCPDTVPPSFCNVWGGAGGGLESNSAENNWGWGNDPRGEFGGTPSVAMPDDGQSDSSDASNGASSGTEEVGNEPETVSAESFILNLYGVNDPNATEDADIVPVSSQTQNEPNIQIDSTCEEGLAEFERIAKEADKESYYAYCKTPGGGSVWHKVSSGSNGCGQVFINHRKLDVLKSTGYECTTIHNHPKQCLEGAGLSEKRRPSSWDIGAYCARFGDNEENRQVVADTTGYWVVTKDSDCSYRDTGRILVMQDLEAFREEESREGREYLVGKTEEDIEDLIETKLSLLEQYSPYKPSQLDPADLEEYKEGMREMYREAQQLVDASGSELDAEFESLNEQLGFSTEYYQHWSDPEGQICSQMGAPEPGEEI